MAQMIGRLRTTIMSAGRSYDWRVDGSVDVLHTRFDNTVLRRFAKTDINIPGDSVEMLDTMGADDKFVQSFVPVLLHEMQSDLPSSRPLLDSLDMVIAGDRVQNALLPPTGKPSASAMARARDMVADSS